ncbi:SDR family NAD(P)-dependent oxidoreductase [Pedobacter jamesrossensis]|uniref:SDR family NAD(P)-dependent oxidoreductase n=1 Tax=Pedobacter jamesrossensis TaxID=1908238 RepID=A0ABV8NHV2_9SPHI
MQTILITGANSGIGLATATALAKQGNYLILLVKTQEKADQNNADIKKIHPDASLDFYLADLTDLASVKSAAEKIKLKYTHIDRLINNAGYSPVGISFTKEGYEKSFAANHLGHFVLTMNLLSLLKASAESRVINVSSSAHALGKASRLFQKNNTKLSDMQAYGDGKLANILFTKGLVAHTQSTAITTYCLHPGVVNSNFGSDMSGFLKFVFMLARPFMITTEKGAATSIYLATTAIQNIKKENGAYFKKSKPAATSNKDITQENVNKLWTNSLIAAEGFI